MKVKVQAWGNSLGLRIPKVFANALGVGSGSEMEVKVEDGALFARPAAAIHLEALLAEITAENQHSSTDWGDASGAEAGESTGARRSDLAQLHATEWT